MPTGYEVKMYSDISRIANALERIARAIEETTYGVNVETITRNIKEMLEEEAKR